MMMSDLSKAGIIFKQGLTIASKTTVVDLEKACGTTFSDDYKEFLEKVNGARIALKDKDPKSVPSATVSGRVQVFCIRSKNLSVLIIFTIRILRLKFIVI